MGCVLLEMAIWCQWGRKGLAQNSCDREMMPDSFLPRFGNYCWVKGPPKTQGNSDAAGKIEKPLKTFEAKPTVFEASSLLFNVSNHSCSSCLTMFVVVRHDPRRAVLGIFTRCGRGRRDQDDCVRQSIQKATNELEAAFECIDRKFKEGSRSCCADRDTE